MKNIFSDKTTQIKSQKANVAFITTSALHFFNLISYLAGGEYRIPPFVQRALVPRAS